MRNITPHRLPRILVLSALLSSAGLSQGAWATAPSTLPSPALEDTAPDGTAFEGTAPDGTAASAPSSPSATTPSLAPELRHWSAQYHVTRAHEAATDGALGTAALHLERARYLRPTDVQIREGLDLLRQQIQRERMTRHHQSSMTQGEPKGLWWWRIFHTLPSRIWAWAGLIELWLAVGLWLVVRRMPVTSMRDGVIAAAVVSFILSVASFSCWFGSVRSAERLEPGVVTDPAPRYFRAPDELASPAESADLYTGAVVLIHEMGDDWAEIELAGQQRVWVHARTVEPIAIQDGAP